MSQVLLVEDDPIVRVAYAKVLGTSGLDTRTACDGLEALEILRHGGFDAVVSDINMPRLSGIDFLRKLREERLEVPVVLVTGGPALETAVRAVEYGAFRYLTKPVDIDALVDTVTRAARLGAMSRVRAEAPALTPAPQVAVDPGALSSRLDAALASLWMAYQPIVSWSGKKVFGYEALLRTRGGDFPGPGELVSAAERLGRLPDVGRAVRAAVAGAASDVPHGALLFVNLHPADLADEQLYDPAAPLSAHARRVVLEFTERAAIEEVPDLRKRVAALRRLGFRVAVDDLGAGYSGLTSFATLEPEVVKLDMSLVREVDRSPVKQRLVASMTALARDLGIFVIAEGIETAAERDAMALLGCDLFQGYLFARPEAGFPPPDL